MGRGRKRKACDVCHRRKIQCDGALSNCDWCSHQGLSCTYERGTLRPQDRRSRGPIREQSQRRRGLPPTHSSPSAAISQDYRPAGCLRSPLANQAWVPEESPLFSIEGRDWIRRWTGETALLDQLSPGPLGPPWQRERRRNETPSLFAGKGVAVPKLPEKSVVNQYLQLFRSTPFRLVWPIVDGVLFQATIDSAYETTGDTLTARSCVFAFLAIMSHTQWTLKPPGIVDGEACASNAELSIRLDPPETDMVGLQVYIMRSMYDLFHGDLQAAIMSHATACRILFLLGGHVSTEAARQQGGNLDQTVGSRRHQIQLRKLFWLCYTFDKVLTLSTGQPPCVDDEHCDLTLPDGYVRLLYSESDIDTPPATTLCFFPGDLRLSILKSRTFKLLLCSNKAKNLSDAELLRVIRELDGELENWRTSIPPTYRPRLSSINGGDCFDLTLDSSQKMHIIIIHLEYYYLMATIHRTTSRFLEPKWNSKDQDSAIRSSQVLSVQASRASLEYLKFAAHVLIGPVFWMVIFYPMNAILSIIGHTLLDPLDPRGSADMQLLETTAEVIKHLRRDQDCPIGNLDISRMDSLISEAIRLGKHAIRSARGDVAVHENV